MHARTRILLRWTGGWKRYSNVLHPPWLRANGLKQLFTITPVPTHMLLLKQKLRIVAAPHVRLKANVLPYVPSALFPHPPVRTAGELLWAVRERVGLLEADLLVLAGAPDEHLHAKWEAMVYQQQPHSLECGPLPTPAERRYLLHRNRNMHRKARHGPAKHGAKTTMQHRDHGTAPGAIHQLAPPQGVSSADVEQGPTVETPAPSRDTRNRADLLAEVLVDGGGLQRQREDGVDSILLLVGLRRRLIHSEQVEAGALALVEEQLIAAPRRDNVPAVHARPHAHQRRDDRVGREDPRGRRLRELAHHGVVGR
eukprot:359644-Chlamydomonas_euryale.AAC.2